MIESRPILVGGPLCGTKVTPGELNDMLTTAQGTYLKLVEVPNWLVALPSYRPMSPVYVWEHCYHDITGAAA